MSRSCHTPKVSVFLLRNLTTREKLLSCNHFPLYQRDNAISSILVSNFTSLGRERHCLLFTHADDVLMLLSMQKNAADFWQNTGLLLLYTALTCSRNLGFEFRLKQQSALFQSQRIRSHVNCKTSD